MTAASTQNSSKRTFLGHPSTLWSLSTVEMWERFSYYGMRGLLVLFLTDATLSGGFGWGNADALQLYGWYTGLVYLTPLFGGWLADKVWGLRRAVFWGAALMAAGHFSLAGPALIPSLIAQFSGIPVDSILNESGVVMGSLVADETTRTTLTNLLAEQGYTKGSSALLWAYSLTSVSFYLGLALLIIGNGLFKPNMTTLVGHLYEADDPRRDGGYTYFYMGINLGAFLANFVAGTLGELYGWHYGFSVAGVGMLIGLLMFTWINKSAVLGDVIDAREAESHKLRAGQTSTALSPEEFARVRVIFVLATFSIFFFAAFEQAGGLLNLFAEEKVDRTLWGFEIPTTWFQSLNPFFILLLGPIFSEFWVRRATNGKPISYGHKFAIAFILAGLSFAVMTLSVSGENGADENKINMMWLVIGYLLVTMGELAISPVGLAAVNKLAPLRFASLMMGVWLLSFSVASFLAGQIGALASTYSEYTIFFAIAAAMFACAGILYVLSPLLVRWAVGGSPAK